MRWRMRALILAIIVRTEGRLDSKVSRFLAAHSSFRVILIRYELSSFERKLLALRKVKRIEVSYNLLINFDTQLHTGDTRLHAQKAWEIVSFFATSRTPITHSQSAPGLEVRPHLDYAVSDPPRDVAFPVRTETTI